MVSGSGHRPPVTEGVAEVIVKDINSGEGQGGPSEVPMAFLPGLPVAEQAPTGAPRPLGKLLLAFVAGGILAIGLLLWWSA